MDSSRHVVRLANNDTAPCQGFAKGLERVCRGLAEGWGGFAEGPAGLAEAGARKRLQDMLVMWSQAMCCLYRHAVL